MSDQSFRLALGLTACFVEFALRFAMGGDLTRAFVQGAARRRNEQTDQEEVENLFWD